MMFNLPSLCCFANGGHTKFLVLLLVAASARCQQSESINSLLDVVEANNVFSTTLYQALSSQQGNLVVSPLSVAAALSMVWLGADGNTSTQLGEGLFLPENRTQVIAGYKQLLTSLERMDDLTLKIVNKMYINESFHVNDTFCQSAVENFRSDVVKLNFGKDVDGARLNINQSVENQTQHNIKNLLPAGVLDALTKLVLLNSVYFRGDWLNTFNESDTTSHSFHVAPGERSSISMMYQRNNFTYVDCPDLKFQALKLPYKGECCSMLLILPHDFDQLATIEANITSLNLPDIISNMTETTVNVYLPRFKIETTMELTDILQEIGITDIFNSPDLSGITNETIYVSNIIHKVSIKVTEKGTQAAAATGLLMRNRYGSSSSTKFVANHPFLFLILDETSGAIIFMGRMSQPNTKITTG